MKFLPVVAASLLLSNLHQATKVPDSNSDPSLVALSRPKDDVKVHLKSSAIVKRKGGGGSGARGSASSANSRPGSSGNRPPSSSNSGSRPNPAVSQVRPNYGGGKYYGGGATKPFAAGARSPLGIAPVLLAGSVLALYPGVWALGAYQYPYSHPYSFYNRSSLQNQTDRNINPNDSSQPSLFIRLLSRQATNQGVNETKPVFCLCAAYIGCGCDDNNDNTFLDSIIGDGTYSNLNHTLVQVAVVNGTSSIFLNGTLPNGTSVDDTSGRVHRTTSRNLNELTTLCILIIMLSHLHI